MISEIFEFYYAYDLYPERQTPLSREELSKGMSDEAIDRYLPRRAKHPY